MNDINKQIQLLHSRSAFFEALNHFLQLDMQGEKLGLLVLGIQRFRKINNIYGYEVGDVLLEKVTTRPLSILPEGHRVVRISNSEFGILVPHAKHDGQVVLAANKILKILHEPFHIEPHAIKIKPAIGIALSEQETSTPSELLKQAENALVLAKANNAPYLVYSSALAYDYAGHADIESKLNSAIEEGELELYYQPQIDFKTGLPIGAEALLRWNNPVLGRVSPETFIPIAEQTGQIIPLSFWTLNTALRQIIEWPKQYPNLNVAVNFSAIATQHEDFVDKVFSALQIWGVAPNRLTVEITESVLLSDPGRTFGILKQLKDLGVKISIDDFGTGYSSLSYFKNIPATELKIDQSFVSNMIGNRADSQITQTIISIAHGFDLLVVAEGIEDFDTFQTLAEMGCDIAQGFFMGRPMPQSQFIEWLASYQPQQLAISTAHDQKSGNGKIK